MQNSKQLDWSKWTGAIHVSSEGSSDNEMTGIKYCPGENLPAYQYIEYKPRCSKTRITTFKYVPDVRNFHRPKEELERSVTDEPEHVEAVINVKEPEVVSDKNVGDTELNMEWRSVKELVEDWDRMCTLEENVTYMEEAKTDRRVSDCLLYTSPSPRDVEESRMPSSA